MRTKHKHISSEAVSDIYRELGSSPETDGFLETMDHYFGSCEIQKERGTFETPLDSEIFSILQELEQTTKKLNQQMTLIKQGHGNHYFVKNKLISSFGQEKTPNEDIEMIRKRLSAPQEFLSELVPSTRKLLDMCKKSLNSLNPSRRGNQEDRFRKGDEDVIFLSYMTHFKAFPKLGDKSPFTKVFAILCEELGYDDVEGIRNRAHQAKKRYQSEFT